MKSSGVSYEKISFIIGVGTALYGLMQALWSMAIVATAILGMTGDSTVPPTMGIITKHFGAKQLSVLYGIALTGHQVGAFFSSWFGGICYTWFGNYDLLWTANMTLAAIAAIASYSIRETRQV